MIETAFRKTYQKLCIDPLLHRSILQRIHPNAMTVAAGLVGISVLPCLAWNKPLCALCCLVFSGFLDTLDGSLARALRKASARGAVLDILTDRIVECAIILGLFFASPASRSIATLFMLSSVLICVTSFLIVGIFTANQSEKSFHYSPGLIERAEAFVFWGAMIIWPALFSYLAWAFSALVCLTAAMRTFQFLKNNK